jgi:hypothetical protein
MFNRTLDEIQTRHMFLQRYVCCHYWYREQGIPYIESFNASDFHLGGTSFESFLGTRHPETFFTVFCSPSRHILG